MTNEDAPRLIRAHALLKNAQYGDDGVLGLVDDLLARIAVLQFERDKLAKELALLSDAVARALVSIDGHADEGASK